MIFTSVGTAALSTQFNRPLNFVLLINVITSKYESVSAE